MNEKFGRTAAIFELECPFDNPFQGIKTRMLFVCSAGMLRSPTAANVAARLGYNARSCGTAECALIPISVNLVHWAQKIFFMEQEHLDEARKIFFGDAQTCAMLEAKAVVWNIEDRHDFDNPLLRQRVEELLS